MNEREANRITRSKKILSIPLSLSIYIYIYIYVYTYMSISLFLTLYLSSPGPTRWLLVHICPSCDGISRSPSWRLFLAHGFFQRIWNFRMQVNSHTVFFLLFSNLFYIFFNFFSFFSLFFNFHLFPFFPWFFFTHDIAVTNLIYPTLT